MKTRLWKTPEGAVATICETCAARHNTLGDWPRAKPGRRWTRLKSPPVDRPCQSNHHAGVERAVSAVLDQLGEE